MGAVRNAMQRDQQDPTVLDLDPERSLQNQRPPKKAAAGDDEPPLNEDPAFAKYIRMLKMVRLIVIRPHVVNVSREFGPDGDCPSRRSMTGHTHRCCQDCFAT